MVLLFVCQGDVMICMEVMEASLDQLNKKLKATGETIPENVIAVIAFSVSGVLLSTRIEKPVFLISRLITSLLCLLYKHAATQVSEKSQHLLVSNNNNCYTFTKAHISYEAPGLVWPCKVRPFQP